MAELYKVLMFGDHNWSEWAPIYRVADELILEHGVKELIVISGMAPGADTMCAEVMRSKDVHVVEVPALWRTRRKGAGPQRNQIMRLLEPHEGYCFHENYDRSRGSRDMAKRLAKAEIPWQLVTK